MRNSYESLSKAISDLKEKGYNRDFNLLETGVEDKAAKKIHNHDELNVVKFYRFEGKTNPGDNSVLYVIETKSGEKGLLVDAYGAYSGNISKEMIEKLKIH
ncbi:phosphoribosylpyrophosphate synthetase [Robertkochia aurantiaca]|uniref:phosphoribosylpyrophosphate synthetase n=1 Tax=Robertkochia aurantiaca TaxID=2873700 RepID=UPI001CCB6D73|nr:phosphoribosylpyrophosphate synthetase [Robertkochia sp. 3YJGBD-33]